MRNITLQNSYHTSTLACQWAYGMGIKSRAFEGFRKFRYGFSGKESDSEISGEGNSYDLTNRVYDTRLGKFLSSDPIGYKYPWNSPYAFAENRVIDGIDLEGLEYTPYQDRLPTNTDSWGANTNNFLCNSTIIPIYNGASWAINTVVSGVTYIAHNVTNPSGVVADVNNTLSSVEKSTKTFVKSEVKYFKNTSGTQILKDLGNSLIEPKNWELAASAAISLYLGGPKGGVVNVEMTAGEAPILQDIQAAANKAAQNIGEGKGPVYGTKVHTEFAKIIERNGIKVNTEISYLKGKVVPYGTKGSVRLDAVVGDINNPTAVFDLKTGGATLTKERIDLIRKNLPANTQNIPIGEIKPQ